MAPVLPDRTQHPRSAASEETRGDKIYAAIVQGIMDSDFKPGERLPSEAALAERFNVSRPLVREALARLRDHGLVYSRRGSGSYVHHGPHRALLQFAPVENIADIQRCLAFRATVEGRAAGLAAENHDPRSLALIESAMQELERVIQTGELGVEADFAFHRSVAAASDNDYFLQTLDLLAEQVRVGMTVMRNLSLLKPTARLRHVQDEHLVIFEAIKARNVQTASEAMSKHIDNAACRMLEG